MDNNDYIWLVIILAIVGGAIWLVQSPDYQIRQGLDLQGGLQVLMAADLPDDVAVSQADMDTARQIVDRRVNAFGVTEPIVQLEGDRRILIELPGTDDPQSAIDLIRETALLEFVHSGSVPLPEGMCIRTSLNEGPSRCELGPGQDITSEIENPAPLFDTVMTGAGVRDAQVQGDPLGNVFVAFTLKADEADLFAEYTAQNINNFLTIVLDKRVISSPQISSVIDGGQGTITGGFTPEEADQLATQLRFGSLPIPLRVDSTRQVGATLGELSIEASIRAGTIGVVVVLLFMLIYYRLPGFLADIALIIYALLNFAIFQWWGITLTLPAITGFLLSTGMAVDANILVFERLKEELRRGTQLEDAIQLGFDRAWSSIRDSNIATFIVCFILWSFGRNFGASTVQGFAITLAIGVALSMFTAVIVTRTFVGIFIGRAIEAFRDRQWLLGM